MSTPELSRRAALGVVVSGLGLVGCEVESPDPQTERTSGPPVTDAGTEPSDDPDVALVESVRADIGEMLALVVAAGAARPGLERELRGFRRVHRQHLDALPGEDAPPPTPRAPGTAAALRSRVRSREQRLRGRLADAAVRSESGPLASLFASMSAAVAQLLAVPPEAGRR